MHSVKAELGFSRIRIKGLLSVVNIERFMAFISNIRFRRGAKIPPRAAGRSHK